MKTLVEVNHLRKVYGTKGNVFVALDDINFSVKEGEFIGVMGPSGAGKSTLLNILATIDQPTQGQVLIDGTDLTELNEEQISTFRQKNLGFIFQDFNLLDTLTVKENILLPLTLNSLKTKQMEERVIEVADKFGITNLLDKYPYQISGGQKQRTAACRALIHQPSLILADEPTGALDSRAATDLLESFQEINQRDKTTILMVTHDGYAASYCERVLFIKDGKIFTELAKGNKDRRDFFHQVMNTLSALGGGEGDSLSTS